MGWKWNDDEEFGDSRGFGELGNPNPRGDVERCSTRRIVKSQCKTEEIEPGKFVRKCEKTEQLLRDCVGRPVEVVESNTEYTEDDVTNEVARGSFPFQSSGVGPFDFPGLRNDIENLERNTFSSITRFFDVAEGLKNEFFQVFGMPSAHDREQSSTLRKPVDGFFNKESSNQGNESAYAEFAGKIRDV